jgi:hypothetical protein
MLRGEEDRPWRVRWVEYNGLNRHVEGLRFFGIMQEISTVCESVYVEQDITASRYVESVEVTLWIVKARLAGWP